ncbi:protein Brevis radix-like 2 isoform X1 [Zea mays]|nr:protein Brevis radix-like 2 isoform X1 [Zea mays]XP_008668944.1 protein Brevis radix-like 2 isoform X1 [Zea mays]XP_008668945.1 protein Brevis radix-like 2 isoform X1 [Zea mays]XP_008668946.1 protein Brevis radix-like 2 isoform X1 [Zea mays]XP_020403747.1 protein Brevis radix-like 2 isoform X1 [Zea mays]|eukprot:XP_008668943.1 protein Brevis radix-like 2 [Zea mays]
MLACIACSSKEGAEDGSRAAATTTTPHGKEAVKSLTSQLKDMVLKFSGSSKQCKGTAGTQSFRSSGDRYRRPYPGFIDDTGFTPASKVLGEDYYPRTALAGAAGAAGGARTASSDTLDMGRSNRKSPGSSGWIPGTDEAAAGGDDVLALEDAAAPREWTAQVEPGVQITFGTIPTGGNDLKRIRFSREMFNKWEAQRWWGENYDRIVELYNVVMFSGRQQGCSTPVSSVDDLALRDSSYSRGGSTSRGSPITAPPPPPPLPPVASKEPITRSASYKATAAGSSSAPYAAAHSTRAAAAYFPSAAVPDPSDHVWAHHFNMLNSAAAAAGTSAAMGGGAPSSYDPSRATTSSRDEASVSLSNVSDLEATEWIEEDEPGVCLTIRELGDGTRELRRIRFSREIFGEDRAKVWWEQNRERIQAEYL